MRLYWSHVLAASECYLEAISHWFDGTNIWAEVK